MGKNQWNIADTFLQLFKEKHITFSKISPIKRGEIMSSYARYDWISTKKNYVYYVQSK